MAKLTFPVEASHIMMFANAISDTNPVYHDAAAATKTSAGGIVAPPSFAQSVAQFNPDYFLRPKPGKAWFGSGSASTTRKPRTVPRLSARPSPRYCVRRNSFS